MIWGSGFWVVAQKTVAQCAISPVRTLRIGCCHVRTPRWVKATVVAAIYLAGNYDNLSKVDLVSVLIHMKSWLPVSHCRLHVLFWLRWISCRPGVSSGTWNRGFLRTRCLCAGRGPAAAVVLSFQLKKLMNQSSPTATKKRWMRSSMIGSSPRPPRPLTPWLMLSGGVKC